MPIAETVKRIDGDRVAATLDRTALAVAQTPQGIRRDVFREALAQVAAEPATTWTDEAALLEACRIAVHVVDGEPDNLKVTVPADLARAERLLGDPAAGSDPDRRTGIGQDSHPFGPGAPLRARWRSSSPACLGSHGHSDGDVALHAVADALLGAAGLGDLGRLFPAGPSTPAGIDSCELLDARRRAARTPPAGAPSRST